MKKSVLVAIAFSAMSAFAVINTENTPNVEKINKVLWGSTDGGKVIKLNGKTSSGVDCLVQAGTSRFGTEISITEDTKPNKGLTKYRISVSAGTSSEFKMAIGKSTLTSSQVAHSADERGSYADKQTLTLTYSGPAPKALSKVEITNISGDLDDNAKTAFDSSKLRTVDCILE